MQLRSKMLSTVLGVVLVASAAMAQNGPSGPRGGDQMGGPHGMGGEMFGPHSLRFFSRVLNLTDAQQAQIRQLGENEKPTLKPLWQQEKQNHQAMMQLITSGNFEEAKAQAIAGQEAQVHSQMAVEEARVAAQAYQLLTTEQKTKLTQFIAEREQRMTEHMQPEQAEPDQAPAAPNQ
jgi:protein CpxP